MMSVYRAPQQFIVVRREWNGFAAGFFSAFTAFYHRTGAAIMGLLSGNPLNPDARKNL
jgi:hypothetical protein